MAVVELTTIEEIETALKENKAYIKVSTTSCGPCKMMSPLFEKLATEETTNNVKYYSLIIDQNKEITTLVKNLGITSVPVFLIIKSGAIVKRVNGAMPFSKLKENLGV